MIASSSMATTETGRAFLPICECPLAPVWGTDVAHTGFGAVHLEANLGNGHVLILDGGPTFPKLQKDSQCV